MSTTRNTRERRLAMKAIGPSYRRYQADWSKCWYCGDERQCWDHAPPLAVAVDIDLEKFRKAGGKLWLVPACLSCNGLLGALAIAEPEFRLAHLYPKVAKRVERLPVWDDDEISELGRGLKAMVLHTQNKQHRFVRQLRGIERRLVLEGRANLLASHRVES